MKALLIHPPFPATFWSFAHALPFVRKKAALPPLGLLTVGALLPASWEKRLVDVNVRDLTDADLSWADYAFIGGMAIQREGAQEVIRRCGEAGVPVVAGGPLYTSDFEDLPEVDHFILDEAEVTLPRFLADLHAGRAERVYRADGFADVTRSPVPLWELADLRQYQSVGIQYSRGCPYDCEFCNVTALFGRVPRVKAADQVTRELNALRRSGWRGQVFFTDDNLVGYRKHVKRELLPALIDWRRSQSAMGPFYTQASINMVDDDELLDMMVDAGFDTIFIGIETPEEEGLLESNKKHNMKRDLLDDVRNLHRRGIQVQAGFIVGFDSDEPSIFERQIRFIQNSGIVTAMVGLLQAPAGTRLYERLREEGRLLGRITGDNSDGTTNIVPKMDRDVLMDGYRRILEHIYSPKHYYQRVRTFLAEYRPPRIRGRWGPQQVLALCRSVYRLGIRGEERRQYWSLLLWTLVRRPRLLPLAVTLAIYGYHFRRVAEVQTH